MEERLPEDPLGTNGRYLGEWALVWGSMCVYAKKDVALGPLCLPPSRRHHRLVVRGRAIRSDLQATNGLGEIHR